MSDLIDIVKVAVELTTYNPTAKVISIIIGLSFLAYGSVIFSFEKIPQWTMMSRNMNKEKFKELNDAYDRYLKNISSSTVLADLDFCIRRYFGFYVCHKILDKLYSGEDISRLMNNFKNNRFKLFWNHGGIVYRKRIF